MSNPKRVWDSNKRAVRQGKEQVWLVDWEKVVNTNHWFAEATWTDVVYDSSWEAAQEPLQTYENWWSEDVPSGSSITINRELSETTWAVGSQINIYFFSKNAFTTGSASPVLSLNEVKDETWEWYNHILVYDVLEAWTVTVNITDNVTWDSDSIEFTWYNDSIPVESITIPEWTSLDVWVWYFKTKAFECSPVTANDVSNVTVSFSVADIVQCTNKWVSDGYIYFELNPIAEGTTTAEIFVWETSQGTINITSWEFVHVESISQWELTATLVEWENSTYIIPITPSTVSDCGQDIIVVSDDDSVAYHSGRASPTAWQMYIYWASVWTTQLHYYLGSAPETVYDIDVTVTAPQPTVVTVPVAVREWQESYWSVSDSSATAEVWTQITTSGNTVTIWNTTITATANAGYEFDEWLIFAWTDDYISADVDNHVAAQFREVL